MISRSFLLILVPTFISVLQQGKAFTVPGAEQMFPGEAANLQKDESIMASPLHKRKIVWAND